jgi:hypothetical protein
LEVLKKQRNEGMRRRKKGMDEMTHIIYDITYGMIMIIVYNIDIILYK